MRRSWSVGFAAAVALVIVGCGSQKPATTTDAGTGTAKGVAGQFFYVNLFRPPLGGIVTSDVGGISCGASSLGAAIPDSEGVLQYNPVYFSGASSCGSKGQTRFEWSQTVTLTAAPQGGNAFISWAGDCAGSGPTCTLSAGADKTVVAIFGPPGSGHTTPFPNRDHAPAYFRFLANDPAALRCTTCHGQNYGGQGIAPSCNACHASAGWANWQQSCSFCHGLVNDTTKGGYDFALHPEWSAPPYDVDGRVKGANGPAVGAHQAHVATNAIRAPIACSECHVVPATAIHTLNGSIDITFGPLSQSGQAHPTWNSSTLTCSATYCHGNFSYGVVQGNAASPSWGQTLTGCTSCHDMPPAGHMSVGSAASGCAGCHPDTVLPNGSIDLAKGRHINGVKDGTGGACDSCHWFPYPSAVPPTVPFAATGAHLAHYGLVGQGTTGYGDLDTLEVKFPTPPPPTSAYAFGCGNCHPSVAAQHSFLTGGTTAKVVLFENNLAPALKSKNAPTAAFAAGTCSGVYCHGNVSATPAWNASTVLACNSCHGTSTNPGGAPTGDSHVLHGYSCNTCHAGTTSNGTTIANTALHVNGRPDVAEGAGATFTYSGGGSCSNISCHYGQSATWGTTTSGHLATLGSGDILVFPAGSSHDVTPLSVTESCTTCHAPSLVTQHASKCDLCHQGANPAAPLVGTWDKTCTASGCHAAVHGSGPAINHDGMYWNSSARCDTCHDTSGGYPGPAYSCTICHDPSYTIAAVGDHLPPTTTSNAVATYVGGGSIHLTATDAGTSGVSVTWFSMNGGRWSLGTDVPFGAPATGSRTDTLQYYSVDHARNTEATKSVSFTVQAAPDTTPPVTTCSAVAGSTYTGAQTFTLSASDVGTGVASTWYRLDTAPSFTQGTSIPVAAPASGSVSHTIQWYSRDAAGNQEATKSVTFTVAALPDAIPPTTTSSFNPTAGQNLKANQSVTLSATDNVGGSGVKWTYYKVDAGAFVQGTSFTVSGDGLHNFSYYSVDNANNTETTHVSNSFRIDTAAPVTSNTAVNGSSYTGAQTFTLSGVDTGGSGVASTSYKLDAAAFTSGASISVAAPASGSVSHTIQWYSIDNAGNQEATKSVTFTVQAAAAPTGSWTRTAVGTYTFTIPAGVTSLTIDALGGGGGGGIEQPTGTGTTGGTATITYVSLNVIAIGGNGGANNTSGSGVGAGGSGGGATCTGSLCSWLTTTPGTPGQAGDWYPPPDDMWGMAGLGGLPNGMPGTDPQYADSGGPGGGGGGGEVKGTIPVTPGGTMTVVIGLRSSVTFTW